MKITKGLSKAMSWLEELIIVLLMTFMVTMNFINVIARKAFSASFSFTEELTIIAFVWVTMMGISAAYKRAAHLGMTFIVDKMRGKARAIILALGMMCSIALLIVMIFYGFRMVQGQIDMNATTPALKLPTFIQSLSIPVGGIFCAIRTIQASGETIIKSWKGNELTDKEVNS